MDTEKGKINISTYSPSFKFYLFIPAVLGLCRCAWGFSSWGKWGLLSTCALWASHRSGLSGCGAQALGTRASEFAAHGLRSCGAQP